MNKHTIILLVLLPIMLVCQSSWSQNLEVEGQAKISVMNSDPTAQYVVVRQSNGILAVRDVSTLTDADSDPVNEIQDLSLSGNILTITNNGTATAIDLSAYLDDTDTQLTESQVDAFVGNNGYLSTEVDGSVTNELELPQSPNLGEMNYWDGTEWVAVPTGADGESLTLCAGIPKWTSGGMCPTCSDGIQNQGETGIDCGGPYCAACPVFCTGTATAIVDVTNPTTSKTWMDRNLGATQAATSSTDANAYGDLYQWGRATDGHQCRTSSTTTTLSTIDQPVHGDFIIAPNSPFDWRSGQNNNLWQGVNGVNNPCPSGYRIPTEAEWDQERLSWSSNNAAGAFTSPLKLPMAGSRNRSDGLMNVVGTRGRYWSSTVSGTNADPLSVVNARYLLFISVIAFMSNDERANGLAVRCLKD